MKDYRIMVQGRIIPTADFLKILRKTRDGMKSASSVEENPLGLSVAYAGLRYELANAKKGGAKRGFLEAEKQSSKDFLVDNGGMLHPIGHHVVDVLHKYKVGTLFVEVLNQCAVSSGTEY